MLERGFEFAPGYRLEAYLGKGQFGQVWRVSGPGRTVAAVKFVDLTEGQWQREYDGIRRVKGIRHTNLMPITAIWLLGKDGKVLAENSTGSMDTVDIDPSSLTGDWIQSHADLKSARWMAVAMLLGGKNLEQRLAECIEEGEPGIPVKELLQYMDEAAKGIDFLNAPIHEFGQGLTALQHCDIKPANIVLLGTSAVVCDFGVSRILAREQATATSIGGSPAYMAPEAIGRKPSRTSDQYSLAITYYQLRTNKLPFNTESLWEVLDAHRLGSLSFEGVPEPVRDVLARATALEWSERYDSNVEMVEALRAAEFYRPPLDSVAVPGGEKSNTRQVAILSGAGLSLVILMLIAWSWWRPTEVVIVPPVDPNQANAQQTADVAVKKPFDPEALATILAMVDNDPDKAIDQFRDLATTYPQINQPNSVRLTSGVQNIDSMTWTSGDASRLIVYGIDDQRLVAFDLNQASPPIDVKGSAIVGTVLSGHSGLVNDLAISDATGWGASGDSNGEVCLWDLNQLRKEPRDQLSDQDFAASEVVPLADLDIQTLAWHPRHSQYLVAADIDRHIHVIQCGDSDGKLRGAALGNFATDEFFQQLEFSDLGTYLIGLDRMGDLYTFPWENVESYLAGAAKPEGRKISTAGNQIRSFQLVSDGIGAQAIVAAGELGDVTLYNLEGQQQEKWVEMANGPIISMSLAGQADGLTVICGDDTGSAVLRKSGSAKIVLQGHRGTVTDATVTPNGTWVATCSLDRTVIIRNIDRDPMNLSVVAERPYPQLHAVGIDPSGAWLVAGGENGNLFAWDFRHIKLLTMALGIQADTVPSLQPEEAAPVAPDRSGITLLLPGLDR
jgi:serine/threonine protein kinase